MATLTYRNTFDPFSISVGQIKDTLNPRNNRIVFEKMFSCFSREAGRYSESVVFEPAEKEKYIIENLFGGYGTSQLAERFDLQEQSKTSKGWGSAPMPYSVHLTFELFFESNGEIQSKNLKRFSDFIITANGKDESSVFSRLAAQTQDIENPCPDMKETQVRKHWDRMIPPPPVFVE